MYYNGTSYKLTAETMDDAYDMPEPSKETLYRWVTEYSKISKDILDDFPAHTSGKWVADEIQVKVVGEKLWLWNIMDANTRYALVDRAGAGLYGEGAVHAGYVPAELPVGPRAAVGSGEPRGAGPSLERRHRSWR